jgi:hypothetical protein
MNDADRLIEIEHTLTKADEDLTALQTKVLSLEKDNAELRGLIGDLAEALTKLDVIFGMNMQSDNVRAARGVFNTLRDNAIAKTRQK